MTHQLDLLSPPPPDAPARRSTLSPPRQALRSRLTSVLVDVPRAANADPETSHEAAERIKQSGALGEQQQIVLDAVRRWPGSTSAELARHVAIARGEKFDAWRSRTGRRLPELAVFHVTRGLAKVCEVNGTNAITWWPA